MNEKLNSLIKKIILGTTAVGTAYAGELQITGYDALVKTKDNDAIKDGKEIKIKRPAFLLQKPSDQNFMKFLSHRSHRSHSSHRSHYSHVSSYTQPRENEQDSSDEKKKSYDKNRTVQPSQNENKLLYEFGSRTLKRGMNGTDVVELQEKLNKAGYELKLDGNFGETTEAAVKDFQKKNNIEVTGIVDVVTIYYMKK